MKFQKKTWLLLAAAILLCAAVGGLLYVRSHVFVCGKAYPNQAEVLDLRGQTVSVQEYNELSAALPQCSILWDIPFQGTAFPSDAQELTVTALSDQDLEILSLFPDLKILHADGCRDYGLLARLAAKDPQLDLQYTVMIDGESYPQDAQSISIQNITDEEIALLPYLPQLSHVDAVRCSNLPQLRKMQEAIPELMLDYTVSILGTDYTRDIRELTLTGADPKVLTDLFFHLPQLQTVTLLEPAGSAEDLHALRDAYPGIQFAWEKEVLGVTLTSADAEADLSNTQPASLEEIEGHLAWFPSLEKVILCGLDFDNETMAAFRERMREQYKVVWNVEVGYLTVRTDETTYMPGKHNLGVTEEQAYNLRYCEDMVCIDVGHKPLFSCDWAAFMPHLKYLIIADTMISDITPLTGLEELIYLEMFITKVTDYSPLLTCTALEDLNLCYTHGDPEPIQQMTWLKRLWWAESPIEVEEFQKYLPDTQLMFLHHSSTGNGWRQGQHYYDMRDMLGMHYMWG